VGASGFRTSATGLGSGLRAPEPKTAKGRATRDRIVDAACDLVFERGVASLNLDDLRQLTDTSKSQLYHYFQDKDDLVHAVVVRQGERVLAVHRPALEAIDGWARLKRWRDLNVRLVRAVECHGGCPVGSLANELAELDELSRLRLVEIFDEWQGLIVDALRRMVAENELRKGTDVSQLATATMASLQGGLLLTKTTRSVRPLEVALDSAIAYIRTFTPPKGT
jgi:AcrR family transcriptional regulator